MKIVSIIIPIYNEENSIKALLKKIESVELRALGFVKEIVCVDDGSTDNTASIIKKFKGVKYFKQRNQGKGAAVQKGIKKSKGKLILVQDADLEYDPSDYKKLLKPFVKKNKIAVYGSRYFNKSLFSFNFFEKEKQSFLAFIFNFFYQVIFLLFGKYYTDLLTGYKVYEKSFFKKLILKQKVLRQTMKLLLILLKKDIKY